MPYLNKENKEGFLYCLFGQTTSGPDAHGKLKEYLGEESSTVEEVTSLFQKFDDGTFECHYPKKLLLVEKLEFKKHTILELCDIFGTHVSDLENPEAFPESNFSRVVDCFKHGLGMEEFCNALWEELMRRKLEENTEWNYCTRDFLNGFIRCLKYQEKDQEEIYEELKKLTRREAYTLEDVAEVIDAMINEDVLVEEGYDFSTLPEHVVDCYLGYTDVCSRVNIRSTCKVFNSIDKFLFDMEAIHVNFGNKLLRIVGIDDVVEKQYQILEFKNSSSLVTKHCLIHENENVWLERDIAEDYFYRKFKNLWNSLRNLKSKQLKQFRLSFEDDFTGMEMVTRMFEKLEELPVEKLFIYSGGTEISNEIIMKFKPFALKKIAIYSTHPLRRDFFSSFHLFVSNEFISSATCHVRVLHRLWFLKFARIRTETMTKNEILGFLGMILMKSEITDEIDFREIKIEMDYIPDDVYDAINIEFETFNQRHTENPRFAEFPFPEPNQDKKLKVALFGNICWFRGPNYKYGEMEAVEKELEENLARAGSRNGIPMHKDVFTQKTYTRATGYELEVKDEGETFEQEVLPDPVEAVAEELDNIL
ncbi:hypothetical protein CAEBREN_00458 [Caenorhabditis brenneri]|uniref:DUF38 domain-containing protein n=1 Tax=Caenorhabditis brenneri TaxID=135651 RepID=G0N898_CAEBE|nr:hypothetical protein CAEBREN_00458 [Caenorhabditis brenneri]